MNKRYVLTHSGALLLWPKGLDFAALETHSRLRKSDVAAVEFARSRSLARIQLAIRDAIDNGATQKRLKELFNNYKEKQ